VSNLKWKTPSTPECVSARVRLDSLATDRGVIDPARFNGNELALINAQQQAEENDLASLSVLSTLVYEAVRGDCLVLPPPPRG